MSDTKSDQIVAGWEQIAKAYQARYKISTDDIHFGPMCPGNSELGIISHFRGRRVLAMMLATSIMMEHLARSGT